MMKLFIPISLALILASCGTHAPMSEMVMFSQKKVEDKTYNSVAGFGISYQQTFPLDIEKAEPGAEFYPESYRTINIHPIFMAKSDTVSNVAFSLALGNNQGVDFTTQLLGNNYLTVGVNTDVSFQAILQRRLIYNNTTGAAAGIYYNSLNLNYTAPCSEDCYRGMFAYDLYQTQVAGIRFFIFHHSDEKVRTALRFDAKAGYAFKSKSPIIQAGISWTVF
ncbi:MAG: hypothetical protein WD016_04365 [Balneolaceae bacterium]